MQWFSILYLNAATVEETFIIILFKGKDRLIGWVNWKCNLKIQYKGAGAVYSTAKEQKFRVILKYIFSLWENGRHDMTAQLIITHFMLAAKNTYDQEVGGWKGKHVVFF